MIVRIPSLLVGHAIQDAIVQNEQQWLWGVIVCICGTAFTALGLVLQKLSLTLNQQKSGYSSSSLENGKVVPNYKQPIWLLGFTIFMVSQIINMLPMATTPQVMLSCIGASMLIFNAFFSWLILREELHLIEVGAMVGIVCAVAMVISTTPIIEGPAEPTLHDMLGPFVSPGFIALTAFLVISMGAVGITIARSTLAAQHPEVIPLYWALCAAVSSGYTVNLFKAVVEFSVRWHTINPHLQWECYAVLVSALAFGVSQVHCTNIAFVKGRAMMVVPTYFALSLLAQLLISEMVVVCLPETRGHAIIFASGIVLILCFIVVLVRAKIAYEEEPEAIFEEVMQRTLSLPLSPKKSLIFTPTGARPIADFAPDSDESDLLLADSAPDLRSRSKSSWDCNSFNDSFEGGERTYSVAVIGIGVA